MNSNNDYNRIHHKTLVVDTLSFPYILEDKHFNKVKKGEVDSAVITIAISEGFNDTIKNINAIMEKIEEKDSELALAVTAQQIVKSKEDKKLSLILGFQDITPIEGDIGLLKIFYRLGIRIVQLTYTGGNLAGDGCGEKANGGLRYFGMDLIEEMNSLGILIDLSHTGDTTTMDTIKHSKAPVVYTHSNCRALCNNPRNKTDEQIKAMAETGGFMGLTPHPALVSNGKKPNLNGFIDHVDHIVKLVGIDYVGIGLDYMEGLKEGTNMPESVKVWRSRRPDIFGTIDDFYNQSFAEDIDKIEKLSNFTEGLLKRGYTENQTEKILGKNFLRVFKEVAG